MSGVTANGPVDLRAKALWVFDQLDSRTYGAHAEDIWVPDAVDHFLAVGTYRGRDAIVEFLDGYFAAFPDLRIDVEDCLVDGQRVVLQWRSRGTFSGRAFQGVEPTHRAVDLRGCDIAHMDDHGRVLENTVYWDGATFARAIGMLPARDSSADRALMTAFNALTRLRRRRAISDRSDA